jgi:hypothetical protein
MPDWSKNVDLELADIGTMIQAHNEQNPGHGYNCICMDRHIQGARRLIQSFTPEVQERLRYVLNAATRI